MIDRRAQILEALRDGFLSNARIAEKLGFDDSNAGRWMNKLEARGDVERVYQNKTLFWKLREGGARPEFPAVEPMSAPAAPSTDRVALAEELVELERRRLEILEALK